MGMHEVAPDPKLMQRASHYAARSDALGHQALTSSPVLRPEYAHLDVKNAADRLFLQNTYPSAEHNEPLSSREAARRLRYGPPSTQQQVEAIAVRDATPETPASDALLSPLTPITEREQRDDPALQAIRQLVEATTASTASESKRIGIAQASFFVSELDGLLRHRSSVPHGVNGSEHYRVVVPQVRRKSLLEAYHVSPIYGHRGYQTLYELLSRYYYWPGMYSDCRALSAVHWLSLPLMDAAWLPIGSAVT